MKMEPIMKIRISLGLCLVLGTGFIPLRAADNPAQAAARAALMEKISGPNAQPVSPASPMPATATPPPTVAQFAPAPTSPATLLAPAGAQDTPTQAAARAALTERIGGLNARPNQPANPAPQASVVMTPTNKQVSKADKVAAAAKARQEADQAAADLKAKRDADRKAAAQKAADEAAAKAQAKAKAKADAQQAAAELKAKKEAEATAKKQAAAQTTTPPAKPATPKVAPAKPIAQKAAPVKPAAQKVAPAKPAAPEVAPVVKPPPPANANYAGKSLGLPPYVAPPPPVSAQQDAELQALLAKYMANQMSPDEYQKERAAILAGH
jgi:hypothetical protein